MTLSFVDFVVGGGKVIVGVVTLVTGDDVRVDDEVVVELDDEVGVDDLG